MEAGKNVVSEKPVTLCCDTLETFVTEVDYENIRQGAATLLGQYDEEFTGEEVVSVSEEVGSFEEDSSSDLVVESSLSEDCSVCVVVSFSLPSSVSVLGNINIKAKNVKKTYV
jgi:hypothetical protein